MHIVGTKHSVTDLLDTGTIIFLESSLDLRSRSINITQALAVQIFGFGSHARNSQDLLILLHALLELAKEDP